MTPTRRRFHAHLSALALGASLMRPYLEAVE